MNSFDEIKSKIESSRYILVTTHINPDGDAIGAGLSLTLALQKAGKNTKFVLQDLPTNMNFLEKIEIIEQYNPEKMYNCDLFITVDSANLERIGKVADLLKNKFIINIDHHISNSLFGNYNFVENISSTSEIIYKFLKYLKVPFDKAISEALYLGIINDTGNFKHDNVTQDTFAIASELLKYGARSSMIVREFFNTKSYASIKLLGKAMYEMSFDSDKKLAYYFISKDTLDKYHGTKEDTNEIVETLLKFKDSEVSLFLREDVTGIIKGSLRSKHNVDVNKIANIFGGGGHIKAAGFSSTLKAEEIIKKVLENL